MQHKLNNTFELFTHAHNRCCQNQAGPLTPNHLSSDRATVVIAQTSAISAHGSFSRAALSATAVTRPFRPCKIAKTGRPWCSSTDKSPDATGRDWPKAPARASLGLRVSAAAKLVLQAEEVEAEPLAQALAVHHALHPVHWLALAEQQQRGQALQTPLVSCLPAVMVSRASWALEVQSTRSQACQAGRCCPGIPAIGQV